MSGRVIAGRIADAKVYRLEVPLGQDLTEAIPDGRLWLQIKIDGPLSEVAIHTRIVEDLARIAAGHWKSICGEAACDVWTIRASRLVKAGGLPLPDGFSQDEHLSRLASLDWRLAERISAINPEMQIATEGEAAILCLAAEWLASRTNCPVVLLTTRFKGAQEPERLRSLPRWMPALPSSSVTGTVTIVRDIGKPHSLSESEQHLGRAIEGDSELSRLFELNRVIEIGSGHKVRIDLLWRAGRIAVELDNFALHGTETAFHSDRQRDFELVVSGYVVLRITDDEVFEDTNRVLEKIRTLVRFRRTELGL